MTLALSIIILLFIIAALVWNLVPAIRAKMRGFSTVVEGALATIIGYAAYFTDWYGAFIESIEGTPYQDWMPENLSAIIPALIVIWSIIKRVQTKTAVGSGE